MLSKEVARVARQAGIAHAESTKSEARRKHLHDVRDTFATRLIATTDLTEEKIASIMDWSSEEVERIRRIDVDDTARNVALGCRTARGV